MRRLVIRGFGEKKDSRGRSIDFERVQRDLIAPVLRVCGIGCGTMVAVDAFGQIH